jgi:hypothetical protein
MPLPATTVKAMKAVALFICGGAGIFGVLGVLQAASLYQGSRALWNANLWSTLVFIALVAAGLIAWPGIVLSEPRATLPRSTYFWLAVAAFATWPLIKQFVAIDACLDAGGSYDSIQGQCSMNTSHPYVPTYRTHGLFMGIAAISSILACLSYVSAKRTRRPSQSAA